MSVREEEKNKNCPSRGLGIAAAAIGVGVGAALYYFFNNRNENPAREGATSSGWEREEHALQDDDPDSSYTISDTSGSEDENHWSRFIPNAVVLPGFEWPPELVQRVSDQLVNEGLLQDLMRPHEDLDDDTSSDFGSSVSEEISDISMFAENIASNSFSLEEISDASLFSGLDTSTEWNEWDVTTSSLDVPSSESQPRSPVVMQLGGLTVGLLNMQNGSCISAGEQVDDSRSQAFRKRSWSLEECSICCDIMLKDQEVMSLPCTHRFHQNCIMPWFERKQTCPNCRKAS